MATDPMSNDFSPVEEAQRRFRWPNWLVPPDDEASSDDDLSFMSAHGIVRAGYIVLLVALVALGFASLVPLDSAIVVPGEIIVQTHRKTVQHLTGGTLREILVTDGQRVWAGQVLMRLDDVQARANLSLLQGEYDALTAQQARLEAERDGASHIAFPAELLAQRGNPTVAAAIAGEESAFRARSSSENQQVGILGQRTTENGRMIDGLLAERAAVKQQAALIRQELSGVEQLYEQGFVPMTRILALRRQAADLDGQDGQLAGRIAQMQASNGENNMQGLNLRGQKLSDVVKDLRDVETKRFDTLDRLHAAQDTLARTVITAPVSGLVVGLQVHTNGAVVKPGDTMMEIVPERDVLEVQARVRPEDAEYIHAGLTARINFGSYAQRRLPVITGTIRTISADKMVDAKGEGYFSAISSVDMAALQGYPEGRLIPGMPAEIEINTGSRTMLSYIMSPVSTVLRRGMRER